MNILPFVTKHWYLFTALAIVVTLLLIDFIRQVVQRGTALTPMETVQWINRRDALVLDIRKIDEFNAGHVVGSINIPSADIGRRIAELDKYKSRPVAVVCRAGQDALAIATQLRERGIEAGVLGGGMNAWERAQLPVEK